MIAIPIGYDQPRVAARIVYHDVGEFIKVDDLSVDGLLHLSQDVLANPSYRNKGLDPTLTPVANSAEEDQLWSGR